jgi:hypothetical protein
MALGIARFIRPGAKMSPKAATTWAKPGQTRQVCSAANDRDESSASVFRLGDSPRLSVDYSDESGEHSVTWNLKRAMLAAAIEALRRERERLELQPLRPEENNPVKAALCSRSDDWPRSSARFRENWRGGQAFPVNDGAPT